MAKLQRAHATQAQFKMRQYHDHGSLLNGKAAGAAVYPERLCGEILKGMRDTIIENDIKEEM